MNNSHESLPIVEAEEIIIRSETMEKNTEELQKEEEQLWEATQKLSQELDQAKNENPADFALFKKINGQLRAHKDLLEEVRVVLAIKTKGIRPTKEDDSFSQATEGEYGGALKKMERRAGK